MGDLPIHDPSSWKRCGMSGRESIGVTESHSSPQGQVTPSSSFLTQILDPSRTSNTPRSQLKHRGWHINAVQRGINMDHGYGMESDCGVCRSPFLSWLCRRPYRHPLCPLRRIHPFCQSRILIDRDPVPRGLLSCHATLTCR